METMGYLKVGDNDDIVSCVTTIGSTTIIDEYGPLPKPLPADRVMEISKSLDQEFSKQASTFLKGSEWIEGLSKSLPPIHHPRRHSNKAKRLRRSRR